MRPAFGDAVVGNIGSDDRMNYTALGATINLAARLEGLNKNYGTLVLVSGRFSTRGARFRLPQRRPDQPEGFCRSVRYLRAAG